MSIEALGGYSQDDEHIWLKNPLTPKQIHINAHTPLDEPEDDRTVTQKDFTGKFQGKKAAVYEKDDDAYSFGVREDAEEEEGYEFKSSKDMIEESNVHGFQASNYSAKDIVGSALQNGRSVDEAYTVYKTQKAYNTSAGKTKAPVDALGARKFRAHE